jgi:hypothetical protein
MTITSAFRARAAGLRPMLRWRWRSEAGQSLPEYLTVVGVTAATVILCMGLFVAPVARTFIALFRRLVTHFTSVP